jgi:hypothetical protein
MDYVQIHTHTHTFIHMRAFLVLVCVCVCVCVVWCGVKIQAGRHIIKIQGDKSTAVATF